MSTASERIQAILNKASKQGFDARRKSELSDEQLKQKAKDIVKFYKTLTLEVEGVLLDFTFILESGLIPNIDEMKKVIISFNHLFDINDIGESYVPTDSTSENLRIIKQFIQAKYPKSFLVRFDKAIEITK